MHTLQLRTLLGRVAFAALLPLAITGCDDPTPSTSDSGSDTDGDDDDDTTDSATVTATATVTETATMTATMTDTTPDTDSDSDTTPDTDSGSGTDTTATDSASDTETSDTETSDTEGETEGTTTGVIDCQEVTFEGGSTPFLAQAGTWLYPAPINDLGGADPELFRVEFWDIGDGAPAAGDVDLAVAPQDAYATCETCVRLFEDLPAEGDPVRQYFQSQGTVGISESIDTLTSELTFTGVRLVEMEVVDDALVPLAGGGCIDIADSTLAPVPPAPDGWTCTDASYEDGTTCDCGCGIADPDCADADATTCDECSGAGSCGEEYDTCDVIVADDNTACSIPPGWTCDIAAYGDGATCDCGCGIVDTDCADALVATCESCNGTGSCAEAAADCSIIALEDNSSCDPSLVGWTCDGDYYGTDDGCDCGCGVADPDCGGDATLDACGFCSLTGSCSTMVCDGNTEINPADNAVCL